MIATRQSTRINIINYLMKTKNRRLIRSDYRRIMDGFSCGMRIKPGETGLPLLVSFGKEKKGNERKRLTHTKIILCIMMNFIK